MGEVILWLPQKEIPGCSLVEIGEVIENSPRKNMCRWGAPLGYEGANPRRQSHDIGITSGVWRTSTVGEMTSHFRKSAKGAKMSKIGKSQQKSTPEKIFQILRQTHLKGR